MYAADWLEKRAELTPEKLAVIDAVTEQRLTYREINQRAAKLAEFLYHELGIRSGERLAILAQNRLEHLDLMFAAQKLGALFVPLNFRLAAAELEFILCDSKPRLLFYAADTSELVAKLRGKAGVERFVQLDPDPSGRPEDVSYARIQAWEDSQPLPTIDEELEAPWLILYTGGTTGFPKGAVLSRRMVTWNAVNTAISWDLGSEDIAPVFTPFFHTGGLNVLTTPLLHLGGTLILMGAFQPGRALEIISRERATIVFMVPAMFQMLAQEPGFEAADLGFVRFCISGGAPCPQVIYETYWARGLVFKQGYGLTEVGPNCFALNFADMRRKQGSVGKPVFHSEARLIDDAGRTLGANQVGELLLRGNHLSSGYWQNQAATDQAFSGGWFRTGDLARRDENGYYYIVDRKKDMIISGGENVYPVEVETALYTHPDILEAAVIGIPHAKWGEVPKAFVVLRAGARLTEEEVISYCRTRLAGYKVPKAVEFRSELPRSAAGKILKRELN